MELSQRDRAAIGDLINLQGHLVDAGDLDQLRELFTPDAVYDVSDLGHGPLRGAAAIREAALALGEANPVGHHVTNIVITPVDDRSARVRSKGIGVAADGTVGSVVYDDLVTREPGGGKTGGRKTGGGKTSGWKISRRTVTARRTALGGRPADRREDRGEDWHEDRRDGRRREDRHGDGSREVLERFRRAAISQSVEDMSRVWAADAVWEFPFTLPGLPSRLEGRDDIVNWIAAGWSAYPLKYERYRTVASHDTGEPETIIVEQDVLGTSATTGEFTLPNILVLTARGGELARLRDYVHLPATMQATGADPRDPRRD